MKVYTNRTREGHITAGKRYEVISKMVGYSHLYKIVEDYGDTIIIYVGGDCGCAHLDGGTWEIEE
jgi:hypothetical protein